MPPRVVNTDDDAVRQAAAMLRQGAVVAFPTETVYGLGANTFNPDALRRIYTMKGRPTDNPLIAHVQDVNVARTVAASWDARCDQLAEQFWPGPLTLVLRKAPAVPVEATAGRDTIAVRCPDHVVARHLLSAFGGAVSAPSANRSGHVSPTTAAHVAEEFADVDDLLILDGGSCAVGIESTVVDLTVEPPRVLRPGSVTAGQLREVLGAVDEPTVGRQSASPGTTMTHYAPRTPAMLVAANVLCDALRRCATPAVVLCADAHDVQPPHRCIEMPIEPAAYAARLYGALREADASGPAAIIIEQPGDDSEPWRAVHDRLRRATSSSADAL